MFSAGGVTAARPEYHQAGGGATPTPALQSSLRFRPKDIQVKPVPAKFAKELCVTHHYLHSYPGGGFLSFGVFVGNSLLGVAVLGVGPANIHGFFQDAGPRQVICLARLWLDDRLGRNSESRTLAVIIRQLRRHQNTIKAIVAYSDPLAGHTGGIYRAAGFHYLGLSSATPLYRLPDGSIHHSRSLSHAFGTHSLRHFQRHGISVEPVSQQPKHTYVTLVDPSWRDRLVKPVLPYPKSEVPDGNR